MAPHEQAVTHDFLPYMGRYTSPNKNFEHGYPHSNALLQICHKLERCKLHKASHHPMKCDIKLLTSNYFQQYISGHGVAKSGALE